MTRHAPVAPDDPRMRDYTEPRVTALLAELHERGRPFGIAWGSAATNGSVDGRVLIGFGNAPVATLLNLLGLLRAAASAAERGDPWAS
ncbi:hypothetical protein ACFWA9_14095 [Kitasatospora sp. NPDC059973]|uniref:hypothetical protein n=1 Tax=Kitasatospora sp. NPDC059973 TaxID=3347020 RepID=UPI0036B91C03